MTSCFEVHLGNKVFALCNFDTNLSLLIDESRGQENYVQSEWVLGRRTRGPITLRRALSLLLALSCHSNHRCAEQYCLPKGRFILGANNCSRGVSNPMYIFSCHFDTNFPQ